MLSSISCHALAPWGMQPNTSHDESLVLYHLSSDSEYYTIFRNPAVTGEGEKSAAAGVSLASCSRKSGKKSIFSALASFAAVRNEKLTSWRSTFEMYAAKRSCAARAQSGRRRAASSAGVCGGGTLIRLCQLSSLGGSGNGEWGTERGTGNGEGF